MNYNLGAIFAESLQPFTESIWAFALAFFIAAIILGCIICALKTLKNVIFRR